MNLFEAKKLLINNGYEVIKEGTGWSPRKAEPDFKQKIDVDDVIEVLAGVNPRVKRKIARTINAVDRTREEHNALAQHRNKTLSNAADYLRKKYNLDCGKYNLLGGTGLIVNDTFFLEFHESDEDINSYDSFNWCGKSSDVKCYRIGHGEDASFLTCGTLDEIGEYIKSRS